MKCEEARQELLIHEQNSNYTKQQTDEVREHLLHCKACRIWQKQNREMLKAVGQHFAVSNDEPDPDFSAKVANAVVAEAQQHYSNRTADIHQFKPVYYWLAAAVTLFIFLFAGYMLLMSEDEHVPLADSVSEPDQNFQNFLERSERFLLLLDETEEQFEAGYMVSFATHSELADELREELAILKPHVDEDEYRRLYEVLNHLNHIYREAAVLPDTPDQQEIEIIRNAINQHALISRVRLLQVAAGEGEQIM